MPLRIGEVAAQSGVSIETIRFYEREGVLSPPPRNSSGYRAYSPDTVHRLQFVRRAKELGFTLNEVRELLELRTHPTDPCQPVDARVEEKIIAVQEKIADLQRILRALETLRNSCRGDQQIADCCIMQALEVGDGTIASPNESKSNSNSNSDAEFEFGA